MLKNKLNIEMNVSNGEDICIETHGSVHNLNTHSKETLSPVTTDALIRIRADISRSLWSRSLVALLPFYLIRYRPCN